MTEAEKEEILRLWKAGMPVHEIMRRIKDGDKISAFFRVNRVIVEFMRKNDFKQADEKGQ